MKRFIRPALTCFFPLVKGCLFDIPKYGKHPEKYDVNDRHQRFNKLFTKVNKALRVKYIVLGKENIPNQASLYISNHLSASDPLILYPIIDEVFPITFVAKIELEKMGLIRNAVHAIDGIFMDRNDLRQSLNVMQQVESSLKDNKVSYCIYAEGTRNKDYSSLLLDMHYGSFRPAVKANVPIVPIASFGTHILLKDKPIYKEYPVIYSILKPIYPSEYQGMRTEEIAKLIQSRIQKEVSFRLKAMHHEEMLKLNTKKYRLNRIVG